MCKSFEITVPVLNGESELVQNVETVLNFLSNKHFNKFQWSVVIADNGSTDKTGELSKNMVKKYSGLVKYIRLQEPGVGRALKVSWSQSSADIVGYFDLDLSTDLNHLFETFSKLVYQDYDIVYGTRLNKGSHITGRSLKREITSRVFNFVLKIYLNVKISDGMCGFKFLKRNILKELLNDGVVSNGWFFSTELLVVGEKRGYKLYELPVKWTDSGNSRVKILPLTIEYLRAMRKLKKHLNNKNDNE